jgi:hypothetical protein
MMVTGYSNSTKFRSMYVFPVSCLNVLLIRTWRYIKRVQCTVYLCIKNIGRLQFGKIRSSLVYIYPCILLNKEGNRLYRAGWARDVSVQASIHTLLQFWIRWPIIHSFGPSFQSCGALSGRKHIMGIKMGKIVYTRPTAHYYLENGWACKQSTTVCQWSMLMLHDGNCFFQALVTLCMDLKKEHTVWGER